MEELSKDDLINKWKTERNKLLSELSFCSEHKFNLEAEIITIRLNYQDVLFLIQKNIV